jgi:DNA-directed RNA polymerase specialized sigma24 family protein
MNEQGNKRQTNRKAESDTILQRIGKAERAAVEDCVCVYGNLVWALARKFAASLDEAEEATADIFNDVWARAPFYDSAKYTEKNYILQIAVRRLIKQSAARSKVIEKIKRV